MARVVVWGYPHHITQRGNHRQKTFFRDVDYQEYIALMAEWCSRPDVSIAEKMRKRELAGRPLGNENFVMKPERIFDRMLMPKKAGRKTKENEKNIRASEWKQVWHPQIYTRFTDLDLQGGIPGKLRLKYAGYTFRSKLL